VNHLPASEAKGDFDLVALFHESLDLLRFEIDVVDARFWPQPDLFHEHGLLVLSRFPVLLFLLVLEPAVVQQPADGRDGGWRYLDEVESALPGDPHRFGSWQNAELLSLIVDEADLADADVLIDSKVFTDGSLLAYSGLSPG